MGEFLFLTLGPPQSPIRHHLSLSVIICLYPSSSVIICLLSIRHYLSQSVIICLYLSLSVIICLNPSSSVIICLYPSSSVIIRHYLSLSVFIRHYLSLSVIICHYLSLSVIICLYPSSSSLFIRHYLKIYTNKIIPTLFQGYYDSCDAGMVDDEGFVFIGGRLDDVINVAGHRLSTKQMELSMATHQDVMEQAVIGKVCAFV